MIRRPAIGLLLVPILFATACGSGNDATKASEIHMPKGAGGVGFLPLLMMENHRLIQKHAAKAGLPDLEVRWIELGGPTAMNDGIVSGRIDFHAAGPPSFLVGWDKTPAASKLKGVAAMTSLPMYLNVRGTKLNKLEDFKDNDKIAMTATNISIPAIVIQMYAADKYGPAEATRFDKYMLTRSHPDGVIALLGGSGSIAAHFTSPPFAQRELKDPAVRTIMTSDDVMKGSTTFTMLSTTTAFRDRNPQAVAAVLAALEEANQMIRDDPKMAADMLRSSTTESGFSLEELMAVISDPKVKFTTTPENVMKYATFMHSRRMIGTLPSSWTDLFFEEIHGAPGN